MKITQFTTLIVIIVISWASLFLTSLNQGKQIQTIINNHSTTLKTVEGNQHTNALAIKTYIACLITIKAAGNLHSQEQVCFDAAPEVK